MNTAGMQESVAEEVNRRLAKATRELEEKYSAGQGGHDQSVDGPTGAAYKDNYVRDVETKRAARQKANSAEAEPPTKKEQEEEEEEDGEDDDEDYELRQIREQRLRQLQQSQREKIENIGKGHGQYREVGQDDFLAEVTGSTYVICHFYHRDFPRCEIMNHHLAILAQRHIETKFIKINAEKAPFFVDKLIIRTIPTLILFMDGIAKDKIVGFEGLADAQPEGKEDEWPTVRLAKLLAAKSIIRKDLVVDEEAVQQSKQQKMLDMRKALFQASNDDDDDLFSD